MDFVGGDFDLVGYVDGNFDLEFVGDFRDEDWLMLQERQVELRKNWEEDWRQEEAVCLLRAFEEEVVAAACALEVQVVVVEMYFVAENGNFVDLGEVEEAADSQIVVEEAADSMIVVEEPEIECSCSVDSLVSFQEDLVSMNLEDKHADDSSEIGSYFAFHNGLRWSFQYPLAARQVVHCDTLWSS